MIHTEIFWPLIIMTITLLIQPAAFWTVIGSIATAIMAIITGISLIYTFRINRYRQKQAQSWFYLEEIRKHFEKAIELLQIENNKYMRWHCALRKLKICQNELKNKITEPEHMEIYQLLYEETAFALDEIFKKIQDWRFFLGIKNYQNINNIAQANQIWITNPNCFKINPNLLIFAGKFIQHSDARGKFTENVARIEYPPVYQYIEELKKARIQNNIESYENNSRSNNEQ